MIELFLPVLRVIEFCLSNHSPKWPCSISIDGQAFQQKGDIKPRGGGGTLVLFIVRGRAVF